MKLALAIAICILVMAAPDAGAIEGCIAVNPGQATCSFTATNTTDASASGEKAWKITVKHDGKTTTYRPSAGYYGEPSVESFTIHKGDKVTAKALDAGSSVIVGGS